MCAGRYWNKVCHGNPVLVVEKTGLNRSSKAVLDNVDYA
jgi:hypothetical protein